MVIQTGEAGIEVPIVKRLTTQACHTSRTDEVLIESQLLSAATAKTRQQEVRETTPATDEAGNEGSLLRHLDFHKRWKAAAVVSKLPSSVVGMTRFELATPRPPDAYSNRAELHPATGAKTKEMGFSFDLRVQR